MVSPLPAPPQREATVTPTVLSARLLGADSFAVCLTGPFHQQTTVLVAQGFLTRSPLPRWTKQSHERWRRPPSPHSAKGQRREVVFTPSGGPRSQRRRPTLTGNLRIQDTRRARRSWQERRVRESNALFWASWPEQEAAANGSPRAAAREQIPLQPRPISIQDAVPAPVPTAKPPHGANKSTLQRPQRVDPRQRVLARTRRFKALRACTRATWHNMGVEETNPALLHSCPECNGSCLEISEHLLGCLKCDTVALLTSRLKTEAVQRVTRLSNFWHRQPQLRTGHPSWTGQGTLRVPHVSMESTSPAWKEEAPFRAKVSERPRLPKRWTHPAPLPLPQVHRIVFYLRSSRESNNV